MKEKPIIMTGESVQAILENRKSQSRRVINPGRYLQCLDPEEDREQLLRVSPWQPGMKLWVRETWNVLVKGAYWWQDLAETSDPEDGGCIIWSQDRDAKFFYRADGDFIPTAWVSPLFMPRWASRITLEVVGVRVERVQQISYADCIAEGIVDTARQEKRTRQPGEAPYDQFRALWDSLNAKRGYGWDVNPWVFVIEFRRI